MRLSVVVPVQPWSVAFFEAPQCEWRGVPQVWQNEVTMWSKGKEKGLISITYKSLDELDRISEVILNGS